MRAPKRRRPLRRERVELPVGTDVGKLAGRVSYVGSPEHKDFPSFAGAPYLRTDASRCDPGLRDPGELAEWVREGLLAGDIGGPIEGDFPRYVWARRDGQPYEARLSNSGLGQYKGYPITEDEWSSL